MAIDRDSRSITHLNRWCSHCLCSLLGFSRIISEFAVSSPALLILFYLLFFLLFPHSFVLFVAGGEELDEEDPVQPLESPSSVSHLGL